MGEAKGDGRFPVSLARCKKRCLQAGGCKGPTPSFPLTAPPNPLSSSSSASPRLFPPRGLAVLFKLHQMQKVDPLVLDRLVTRFQSLDTDGGRFLECGKEIPSAAQVPHMQKPTLPRNRKQRPRAAAPPQLSTSFRHWRRLRGAAACSLAQVKHLQKAQLLEIEATGTCRPLAEMWRDYARATQGKRVPGLLNLV